MSLNKCMIIGNLGRDPEMRYTPSGQAVTQFSVATNRNYRDQQGEWQSETEWFRVVVWGDRGERAAETLRKGHKVYVEGRIQTRQWEDQSGIQALYHRADRRSCQLTRAPRTRGRPTIAGRCAGRLHKWRFGRHRSGRLGRLRQVQPGEFGRRLRRPALLAAAPAHQRRLPPTDYRKGPTRCHLAPSAAMTSTATDDVARSAPSAPTNPSPSTTRRSTASAATSASVPRSSPVARLAPAPSTSAHSRWR